MKQHNTLISAAAVVLTAALATPADAPPAVRVALPFDLVEVLDGAKFKTRVPANWNGTLMVYVQSAKTGAIPIPPEPALVPPVLPSSDTPLEPTLLSRGYALAASEISPADWQVKAAAQDTLSLTTYFRGRVGDPKRVILWGSSLGGLVTVRLLEQHPRSFDGAIVTTVPAAGLSRRYDLLLDYCLAYAAAFGWPEEWGPVENLRSGLNFTTEVAPKANWPKPDGSNRGAWEFIRLVNGLPPDAFWQPDPIYANSGFLMTMAFATWERALAQTWAAGPVAQNSGRQYTLTDDEKKYLAGLGVQADDLLAKMNARTNIISSRLARSFIERNADLHGKLTKPLIMLNRTQDTLCDNRHASAYLKAVEEWDLKDNLVQLYVPGFGHNAFTAAQLLTALAAMESWLDSGIKPGAAAFPASMGFDHTYVPPPWK